MFKRLKLSTKILMLGVLIVFCFSMMFVWLYPKIEANMYEAKNEATQYLVETAFSIVEDYGKKSKSGERSIEAAQKRAKEIVRSLRFNGDEYFWINDSKGVVVMHPGNPKLENRSLINSKDSHGKLYTQEIVKIAKSKGEGFLEYYFPKPGEKIPSKKIYYIKYYPQWDWIVASGVYVDDVEK